MKPLMRRERENHDCAMAALESASASTGNTTEMAWMTKETSTMTPRWRSVAEAGRRHQTNMQTAMHHNRYVIAQIPNRGPLALCADTVAELRIQETAEVEQ